MLDIQRKNANVDFSTQAASQISSNNVSSNRQRNYMQPLDENRQNRIYGSHG